MLILNDTKEVRVIIDSYYDGPAGMSASGLIAFRPGTAGIRTGEWPAIVDGQSVLIRIDKSLYRRADHPFLYATIVG